MNAPDATATDFYERLGIERDASPKEIRVAYAQAVREYSPERHPEQFKRIREAYETLFDPESRSEYDATSNPAVEQALERGQEALQEGDYETAVASFRRALVLEPSAHFIRNLLGVTHLHQDAHTEALEQFERLTDESPENHLYWAHRAAAEHGLEQSSAAEAHYRKAIALKPEETGAYQGLAQLLADLGQFDRAEQLIEKAIHADGRVDFDDISLLFELITLRLRQGDVDGIEEVARRVESVITEDWQRQRVAYRFATLAQPLVEFQAFELALALAETSERLAPHDEDITRFTDYIRENQTIIDEWKEFSEDRYIRPNLKALYALGLQGTFSTWDSDRERQQALANIGELMSQEVVTHVLREGRRYSLKGEIEYVEKTYPTLAEIIKEEYRNSLKQQARAAGFVWLTCPYCGSEARAKNESGQYGCPECNQRFRYDSATAEVSKWSPQVGSEGCAWVIYGLIILVLLSLAGGC